MNELTIAAWHCVGLPSRQVADPGELNSRNLEWLGASAPSTVANALRENGRWRDPQPFDLDELDWWYRARFVAPKDDRSRRVLRFEGLAGAAEVWLNGEPLLASDNMFLSHDLDVTARLSEENELTIVFRSLHDALQQKRPRPKWKTNLVTHQQLRWQRTSLLGRIPGWSPPRPIIGPWRDVRLVSGPLLPLDSHLRADLDDSAGVVRWDARALLAAPDGAIAIQDARLRLEHGSEVHEYPVELSPLPDGIRLHGTGRLSQPRRWWPHTHGDQPLYTCVFVASVAGETFEWPLGRVGFRRVDVPSELEFGVRVNETPVYCRGACWTVSDLFRPHGDEAILRRDLESAVEMGANMIRVGGTMIYECDAFYRLCDELGLLVWQDFMFANMDYPVDDPAFSRNIHAEARQQLCRLARHPSVAVYCGNSEVEQQAAMLGVPRERWRNAWFAEQLPELCAELHPGTVYLPSTPSGGALPFHARSGVSHYYGIGAYQRELNELRKADVKFTSECLGFANLPEPPVVHEFMDGAAPLTHHPRWKQRVPRDTGAGWDFEDIRDFYLRYLHDVDPVALRSFDPQRYLALSRTVSGEMMARTFAEWRGRHSSNRGGLVWFFKDLWPSTSWGILDSHGNPKPAWYYLRRAWQPRQIVLTDEALEGIHAHVINELAVPLRGSVEFLLLKQSGDLVARHVSAIDVAPRSTVLLSADEEFGLFYDVTHSYRFGPPHHDIVAVTLFDDQDKVLGEAFHFIQRVQPIARPGIQLDGSVQALEEGQFALTLACPSFLHTVRLTAEGYLPEDNYFHLLPGRAKTVPFRPAHPAKRDFKVTIESLNWDSSEILTHRISQG